jgi:hypothetical protein
MAITDHIAILTHSALAQAVPNRKKVGNPLQFYAVLAFPPAAQDDLAAVLKSVAPGGSLAGIDIRVPRNANTAKPIPGVPGDWFVIRAASQFAPYLADETGAQLDQQAQQAAIRSKFYAGKKVRAALSAYFWPNEGGGISFNLDGVMSVADGERLAIGNNDVAGTFGKYADPNAGQVNHSEPAKHDPFAGKPATGSADPFAQAAKPATGSNPFA